MFNNKKNQALYKSMHFKTQCRNGNHFIFIEFNYTSINFFVGYREAEKKVLLLMDEPLRGGG